MTDGPQVHPPKQQRSSRTLDALLDAAQKILATRTFADMTVAEITRLAESSSGSFYARFADKNVLLHALQERYVEQIVQVARQYVKGLGERKISFTELADAVVYSMAHIRANHPGVQRAVMVEGMKDPRYADRARGMVRSVAEIVSKAVEPCKLTPDELIAEIEVGARAVKAMLDQELFFDPARFENPKAARRIPEQERLRLRRIFLAALNRSVET